MKKILILASNPRSDLHIDREIRDLKKAIKRNQNSEQFEVEIELAVKIEDLDEIIHDSQPYIVHFCGHGAGEQGLLFKNNQGIEQYLSNEALIDLFKTCGKNVKCLILNACYTEVQASLIAEHIPYGIGTNRQISDKAAYCFAIGFYKALVREQSIETCYEWGWCAVKRIVLNLNTVNVVINDSERFRKMEVIEEDASEVVSEPLRIILKRKTVLDKQSTENQLLSEITSDFREEVVNEAEIQQYKNTTRKTWDEFGQSNRVNREPITQNEYRQRKTLLNKVKDFWIKGFLKPSLYVNTAINLHWTNNPDAVLRGFQGMEEIPVELDDSFEELQATDILSQTGQGKTLLILGEPGSGKTITLLQLAEKLVNQTEQDLTLPIPVVFNLSSWGQKQQPIDKWLIQELKDKYHVPKTWSKSWIKQEQLILLLDGLDEVEEGKRDACVRALNKFIAAHNITEMVVSSRVKDYEALTERLQLSSAICIQPLSPQKLYQHLDERGDSLAALKTLLEQDLELEQFAETPLILNIMSLAYQDWSVEELLQQFRTSEDRYQHLFDSYIERMLRRRVIGQSEQNPNSAQYPQEKVLHWLSWLAKSMIDESQTVILIENLQPSFLESINKKRCYGFLSFLLLGSIFGLSFVIISAGGIMVSRDIFSSEFEVFSRLKSGIIYPVFYGFFLGILILISQPKITTFEHISWNWKLSWQKTKPMVIFALIGGIIITIIYVLIQNEINLNEIISLLCGAIIVPIISATFDGLKNSELTNKKKANQGIWLSRNNAIRFGLGGCFIVSILFILLIVIIGFLSGVSSSEIIKSGLIILIIGLLFGMTIGVILGMIYGGTTCIQHFSLRRILYRKGRIPWNYSRFLDYASERLLMKKVGGGYIFYHRMLMEHFAQKS